MLRTLVRAISSIRPTPPPSTTLVAASAKPLTSAAVRCGGRARLLVAHVRPLAALGEITLRFSHTLEPLESGGTKVTHRLEITGPAAGSAGPELGPAITEDFPEAMDALLARAQLAS
jgi:hypothetical protein